MADGIDFETVKETWPWSPLEERKLLLRRFLRGSEEYRAIGNESQLPWFSNRTETDFRSMESRREAREHLAESFCSATELEELLQGADVACSGECDFFAGKHYVAALTDDGLNLEEGPATEMWGTVVDEVVELTSDDDVLYAFLQGIVEVASTYRNSSRASANYDEAEAAGDAHYDGEFWPSTKASRPGRITGVTTRSGNSGRSYRIAAELQPVIEAGFEYRHARTGDPIATAGQGTPEQLERRVPKFQEILDDVEVTEEDRERFQAILDEHDALEYWKDYVAPSIRFRDEAKKAVLCMLASPEDKYGTKGRTNAIFYGPPGTGKTAFKEFLVDEFGACSIDGARVSKPDLTYNKSTGENGLLAKAHTGLAVVDEADEMDDDALGAALTSLGESGQIEIRSMRLPAEVRGVLIGNYSSREEIEEKHSEALFNRFEFVIKFSRLNDDQRDEALDSQYDYFRMSNELADTVSLKKYIKWVREFDPELPEEVRREIKEYKRRHIDEIRNVREGISILTVAYTIARLHRRDLEVADYKAAKELSVETEIRRQL